MVTGREFDGGAAGIVDLEAEAGVQTPFKFTVSLTIRIVGKFSCPQSDSRQQTLKRHLITVALLAKTLKGSIAAPNEFFYLTFKK